MKIVPEPTGTRGYDDLRRWANREPLGHGVRPSVASISDHARMLAALDREHDLESLHTLRRLIELEHAPAAAAAPSNANQKPARPSRVQEPSTAIEAERQMHPRCKPPQHWCTE